MESVNFLIDTKIVPVSDAAIPAVREQLRHGGKVTAQGGGDGRELMPGEKPVWVGYKLRCL